MGGPLLASQAANHFVTNKGAVCLLPLQIGVEAERGGVGGAGGPGRGPVDLHGGREVEPGVPLIGIIEALFAGANEGMGAGRVKFLVGAAGVGDG